MKSINRFLSYISIIALLTLGACSRSDVAKQSDPGASNDDASQSETTKHGMSPAEQPITQQQPGGPPPVEVDANAPKPVDPSQLPMTPSNAPLPTPSMNAPGGAQQVGAPPSESPAGTPPGGVRTQTTVGRPVSEQPVGGGMEGAGSNALKSAVETMLRSQQGFGNVTVVIGSDGCIILAGKVATPEKKEEAAAHTRGVAQGGCVMNRIEVGK